MLRPGPRRVLGLLAERVGRQLGQTPSESIAGPPNLLVGVPAAVQVLFCSVCFRLRLSLSSFLEKFLAQTIDAFSSVPLFRVGARRDSSFGFVKPE